MTWNYKDPNSSDRDKVRFLVGDTCKTDPLVSDEEIAFAISRAPTLDLAASIVLRSLAAKFSRMVSSSVGDVSRSCSDLAKAFKDRADELDPHGIAVAIPMVLPVFGGLSRSEKEVLASDEDEAPSSFRRGLDDIEGGPDDSAR